MPAFGIDKKMQDDPHFQGLYQFYEYFNGDTGEGLGASHQTGWTALIAHLLCRRQVGQGASTANR